MLVGKRMTKPVITVSPDLPIQEAMAQMRREKVRRFPVVNEKGHLVGIVSEKDLLNAAPSDATSLSIYEVNYLISKITVERVMTRDVITIDEDCPIEEAARIMADKKIGSLPVLSSGKLVGIITETDLFKLFLEMMGARKPGVRLTALVSDLPGKLFELTGVIRDLGGNLISVGTFMGDDPTTINLTIKVSHVPLDVLRRSIEPMVQKLVDIREMKSI